MSDIVQINRALDSTGTGVLSPTASASPERRKDAYLRLREKDRKRECREIMKLRTVGLSNRECADVLEMDEKVVVHRIAEGRHKGWVTSDDDARMQHMIDPLTIDGITDLLIRRDKDTLLESARGRGIFKQHQAIKNVTAQITELRVRIESEEPAPDGRARASLPGEVEVIDVTALSSRGTPRLEDGQQSSFRALTAEEHEPEAIVAEHGQDHGRPRTGAGPDV